MITASKPPPIIGVVSKIDGLSPLMEWSPPYDWEEPSRPKEKSIREAAEYARDTAGAGLTAVVPVCTDRERNRVFGVEEWLLPLIAVHLGEARAVSLVRSLHHDYDQQKGRQVVSQLIHAGLKLKGLAKALRHPQMPPDKFTDGSAAHEISAGPP